MAAAADSPIAAIGEPVEFEYTPPVLNVSDAALLRGYEEAVRQIMQNHMTVDPLRATAELPTGTRYLYEFNAPTQAAIFRAVTHGMPAEESDQLFPLGHALRSLAMGLNGFAQSDYGYDIHPVSMRRVINDSLAWNIPAMPRFLLRMVPRAAMTDFIDHPELLHNPELSHKMRAAREDERHRVYMERAMLGRAPGMHGDALQLVAQGAAPSAVNRQRPLRLLTSAAQRARDDQRRAQLVAQDALDPQLAAQHALPTNTDVLGEILAEFETLDTESLKRRLTALHDSIKRQRR